MRQSTLPPHTHRKGHPVWKTQDPGFRLRCVQSQMCCRPLCHATHLGWEYLGDEALDQPRGQCLLCGLRQVPFPIWAKRTLVWDPQSQTLWSVMFSKCGILDGGCSVLTTYFWTNSINNSNSPSSITWENLSPSKVWKTISRSLSFPPKIIPEKLSLYCLSLQPSSRIWGPIFCSCQSHSWLWLGLTLNRAAIKCQWGSPYSFIP